MLAAATCCLDPQLYAVLGCSYVLFPHPATCWCQTQQNAVAWYICGLLLFDTAQLDAESVGAQNYCQDPFLSMFGRSIDYTILSRLSPVDVWRVLELKITIKTVSSWCLIDISIKNYCQDCLLSESKRVLKLKNIANPKIFFQKKRDIEFRKCFRIQKICDWTCTFV